MYTLRSICVADRQDVKMKRRRQLRVSFDSQSSLWTVTRQKHAVSGMQANAGDSHRHYFAHSQNHLEYDFVSRATLYQHYQVR